MTSAFMQDNDTFLMHIIYNAIICWIIGAASSEATSPGEASENGIILDGFIREIRRRQKSFDFRQKIFWCKPSKINLLSATRESMRWLKKSSKEVLSCGGICMRFWDGSTSNWLKISITYQNYVMAHFFRSETLRWLKIRTENDPTNSYIMAWTPFNVNQDWVVTKSTSFHSLPFPRFCMWTDHLTLNSSWS